MVLSNEEAKQIKEQLLTQLGKFPEEKRDLIKDQVESMTPSQVETFVNQNQLEHLGGNCIFCAINAGKMPSVKIDENEQNIAILEINPISKGHTLIIPKEHLEKIPESAEELKKRVITNLTEKFKPLEIKTKESEIMGHPVFEILPIYGTEKERTKKTLEELEEIKIELEKEEEIEEEPIEEIEKEEIPILKPRIP